MSLFIVHLNPLLQMVYQDRDYGQPPLVGHGIYVNGQKILACMESLVRQRTMFRTRVVAGLVPIPANGRVGVRVLHSEASIKLRPDSTFFGFIKLS